MHRPAGRVENLDLPDRLHLFSRDLSRQGDEIVQGSRRQAGVGVHLHPLPAQGVLHQELDNPAGREELRCRRDVLGPDLLLLFVEPVEDIRLLLLIEVLIDPADSLLLTPGCLQFRAIEQLNQSLELLRAGKEQACQVAGVEEHPDLLGEQPALVQQEMPVGHIPRAFAQSISGQAAGLAKPQVPGVLRLCQIEEKAPRILIALQGALDQTPPLHHLEGHQAVEMGESRLLDQPGHRIRAGQPCRLLIRQPRLQPAPGQEQLRHLPEDRDLLLFCEF